eukprot:5316390-Pyramimonas_sp.AAC.1
MEESHVRATLWPRDGSGQTRPRTPRASQAGVLWPGLWRSLTQPWRRAQAPQGSPRQAQARDGHGGYKTALALRAMNLGPLEFAR